MLSCHGFLASMCVPNRLNVGKFTFCSRTFIRDYAFYAFVVDGFVGFISTPCPPLGKKPLLLLTLTVAS